MKKETTVHIGCICQFNHSRDFGIALFTDDRPGSMFLSTERGPREIKSTLDGPVFCDSVTERRPQGDAEFIVFTLYPGTARPKVDRWAFQSDWDKAQAETNKLKNKLAAEAPKQGPRSQQFMKKFAAHFAPQKSASTPKQGDLTQRAPKPFSREIYSTRCLA